MPAAGLGRGLKAWTYGIALGVAYCIGVGHGRRAWAKGMGVGHGRRAWEWGMGVGHGDRAWA